MTSKRMKSEIAECEEVRSSISLVQRYERHENQMKVSQMDVLQRRASIINS